MAGVRSLWNKGQGVLIQANLSLTNTISTHKCSDSEKNIQFRACAHPRCLLICAEYPVLRVEVRESKLPYYWRVQGFWNVPSPSFLLTAVCVYYMLPLELNLRVSPRWRDCWQRVPWIPFSGSWGAVESQKQTQVLSVGSFVTPRASLNMVLPPTFPLVCKFQEMMFFLELFD